MAGLYDSIVNNDPKWVTDLTQLKLDAETAARNAKTSEVNSNQSAAEALGVLDTINTLGTMIVWAYEVTEPTSTITMPLGTTAVPFFMVNGVTHYLGQSFTYDIPTRTVSLTGYVGKVYDPTGSISTTFTLEAEPGDVLIFTLTNSSAANI